MLQHYRNFLSFKDIVTFSMVTAPIKDDKTGNTFSVGKLSLLKSSAIYGANASGKSNLLKSMSFIRYLVLNSLKNIGSSDSMIINKFRLSSVTENEASYFEISFIYNEKKYRYGFEIDNAEIISEWLFFTPSRQEARLFVRDGQKIDMGRYFKEGRGLEKKTRPDVLFLPVVAQFNGEISMGILNWFGSFNTISGLNDRNYMPITVDCIKDSGVKKKLIKYLKVADFNIDDIRIERNMSHYPESPEEIKTEFSEKAVEETEEVSISVIHRKYNDNLEVQSVEKFDLENDESEGTKKFLGIMGPVLNTIDNGSVLIIDEFDARFHPFVTQLIIQLFHSGEINSKNAQLIFATHDTNLLSRELFREDQIWFVEKDEYGATDLYSLVEYKHLKKNTISYENDYMLGKYGAIPFIGNFELLLSDNYEK